LGKRNIYKRHITFNNSSATSWQLVILVEEAAAPPEEIHTTSILESYLNIKIK
jgi:hypothetical protein